MLLLQLSTVNGRYNAEAINVKLNWYFWFTKYLEMKYGGAKIQLHALLTTAQNRNIKLMSGPLQTKARGLGTH
jgi:hypothetical protein